MRQSADRGRKRGSRVGDIWPTGWIGSSFRHRIRLTDCPRGIFCASRRRFGGRDQAWWCFTHRMKAVIGAMHLWALDDSQDVAVRVRDRGFSVAGDHGEAGGGHGVLVLYCAWGWIVRGAGGPRLRGWLKTKFCSCARRRAGPHRLLLGAPFHRGQLQIQILPHTVR